MPRARLSTQSQIVIPAEIRRKLGFEPGDVLLLEAEDDQLVIRKETVSPIDMLLSIPRELWAGAAEEIQRDRDEWDQ
jgi:AbrB family looped-hinge helix DNA binding protein